MKNIISALFLIVVMSVFAITKSAAMDFTIGMSGATSGYGAYAKEKNGTTTPTEEYGAFKDSGGSVFLEVKLNDMLAVGLDYVIDTIKTPTNRNEQDDMTTSTTSSDRVNDVSAEFDDLTTLYVQLMSPWGIYGKAGIRYVDILTKESLGTGGSYNDTDTIGYQLALGYQMNAAEGFFIRAEISGSAYDDVDGSNTTDSSKTVHVTDMISASYGLSIGKTF